MVLVGDHGPVRPAGARGDPRCDTGLVLAVAFAVLLVLSAVLTVTRGLLPIPAEWAALAVVVAAAGWLARPAAAASAGLGWMFFDGFAENTAGQLSWHDADPTALAGLVSVAVIVALPRAVGLRCRRGEQRPRRPGPSTVAAVAGAGAPHSPGRRVTPTPFVVSLVACLGDPCSCVLVRSLSWLMWCSWW